MVNLGYDSDASDIIVVTGKITLAKAPTMSESDDPHRNVHQGATRHGARPTLIVKLKTDPKKLPMASIEGPNGIALQTGAINTAALGNQDKLDILEHQVKSGMAEMKKVAQEAQAERDLARNRSVELHTELDMTLARAADLDRKLRQEQEHALQSGSLARTLEKQLVEAQQVAAEAQRSEQSCVTKVAEVKKRLRRTQHERVQAQSSAEKNSTKVAELEKQLQNAKQDTHKARVSERSHLKAGREADKRANEAKQAIEIWRQEMEDLEEERAAAARMKELIRSLAAECPWQTEKSGAPGGKLLDELLKRAK